MRLRTILFATLFLVAALPGVGAVFLRVYENTLVRQTETELVAQGAALAAAAAAMWPGAPPLIAPAPTDLMPEPPRIDLNSTPFLPERPAPSFAGVVRAEDAVAAARLRPVLATTRRTTLAAIELLDAQGRLLGGDARGSYAALPEVRAALSGRPYTVIRRNGAYRATYSFEWLSRAAAIRVHHARPVIVDGRVVAVLLLSRSARALFRGMYEDRGKIAAGVALILLALLGLTAVLSRGIARPIEVLGAATRAVAMGRGQVPEAPVTAAVEIKGLYDDFAAMAAAIERRSRYLRDFAYAVSHEFKTPLAGIRGAVELLGDHGEEMSVGERARFLANADADAERLALLVSRLLDLARADMSVAEGDAATPLAPVLARVADASGVPVAVCSADTERVAVAAATLETILMTLVENSRQAGAATVTITATRRGDMVAMAVGDDGPGIPPGDRARIFEPFFTTKRSSGGTGLGLPIVRSLLETAGGTIEMGEANGGACFVVCVPVA
jgi:signal transduction histidine kinase